MDSLAPHPEQLRARVDLAARAWLRAPGDALALAPFRDVTRKSVAQSLQATAPLHSAWALRLCEERVVGEASAQWAVEPERWRDVSLDIHSPFADWRLLLARWGARLESLPEIARLFAQRDRLAMSDAVRPYELRAEVRAQLGASLMSEAHQTAHATLLHLARALVQERSGASGLRFAVAAVHLSELLGLGGQWPVTPPRVWAAEHLSLWVGHAPARRRPVQNTSMPSDDARLLRRIGEDYILALRPERNDFAALHTPDADHSRAFGVALAHALAEPVFLSRSKDISTERGRMLAREVARGGLVAAAMAQLVGSPDPRAVHVALETWCEGAPPDWRWLLPTRGEHARAAASRAITMGTWLAAKLRELFDEDWWRNPRAPAHVAAWAHEARGATPEGASPAIAAMDAWVLSVERSVA